MWSVGEMALSEVGLVDKGWMSDTDESLYKGLLAAEASIPCSKIDNSSMFSAVGGGGRSIERDCEVS